MIQPSHPGSPRPRPPAPTSLNAEPAASPWFVPATEPLRSPTRGMQFDLGGIPTQRKVTAQEPWERAAPRVGEEPRPGQAVADRFVVEQRIRGLGTATLYSALDTDLGERVLLLVEPSTAAGIGGSRRELRRADPPEHPSLLLQLEMGSWDGLEFASFAAPQAEPLVNMALPLGGRLPALHVATLAAHAVGGLAALHDDGRLLGGLYPGSLLVSPWDLQVLLVGWCRPCAPERHEERAGHELRSLGKVLLRLRGLRGDHPAEVELDELLQLVGANNLRSGSLPTALVAQSLENVALALLE